MHDKLNEMTVVLIYKTYFPFPRKQQSKEIDNQLINSCLQSKTLN